MGAIRSILGSAAGAALALSVAAAPAHADPLPGTTRLRLVGASLALGGAPASIDGAIVSPGLDFGSATAAVAVAPGRHAVRVGSASATVEVAPGCTLNVVAAERGFRAPPALVAVPACGGGRIRPGASRVNVLVASDEPGRVRASLGDAAPVDVAPFEVSAPLEPTAGPAKFALASATSGALYASTDSTLAAGTSTLVLFVGQGDQGFRLVAVFDGVQPPEPPADIEIHTGLPGSSPTAGSVPAVLAVLAAAGAVVLARRRGGLGARAGTATAAVAVLAAAGLAGCSTDQMAGISPAPVPASPTSAPAPPASTPPASTPPASTPPPAPATPPPAWGFNAPMPAPAPAPRRVRLPAAGIDAVVKPLPTSASSGLVSLLAGPEAAHLTGTFTPGSMGVSVLVGHTGAWGAFARLGEVGVGAEVVVSDVTGADRRFVVISSAAYIKAALPEELWTPQMGRERLLVLISCTGPIRADGLHRDNVVVVAKLV